VLPCPEILAPPLHARVAKPVVDVLDQVRDLPLDRLEVVGMRPGAGRPLCRKRRSWVRSRPARIASTAVFMLS
jgi:hypothetical protein